MPDLPPPDGPDSERTPPVVDVRLKLSSAWKPVLIALATAITWYFSRHIGD